MPLIPARLVRVAILVSEETTDRTEQVKKNQDSFPLLLRPPLLCFFSEYACDREGVHCAGGGRATDVQVSSVRPSVRPSVRLCARATLRFRGEWSPNGEKDDEDDDDDAEEDEEVEQEGRAG